VLCSSQQPPFCAVCRACGAAYSLMRGRPVFGWNTHRPCRANLPRGPGLMMTPSAVQTPFPPACPISSCRASGCGQGIRPHAFEGGVRASSRRLRLWWCLGEGVSGSVPSAATLGIFPGVDHWESPALGGMEHRHGRCRSPGRPNPLFLGQPRLCFPVDRAWVGPRPLLW
jgi:hypothetical protein